MNRRLPFLLPILHSILAVAFKLVAGVNITANPNGLTYWDAYWQNLPYVDLNTHLAESIWNLHAQPPLHNLYGALWIHLFPDMYLEAIHYANIALGALICGMSYLILWRVTHSRTAALVGGLCITLNPGLFLFEAYMLYTVLSLFWIVACVWCVSLSSERPAMLYGFILCANLLVLTRSMYHPLFLIACIGLTVLWRGVGWKRTLVIVSAISLLGFGWATKNALQFGFWGTSSWTGLNLWRVVSSDYSPSELDVLAVSGVIDPLVVELGPFTYPSSYRNHGFDRDSPVESLNRNNYHNINIPAIAQVYQRSAIALLTHDPRRYLRRALLTYNLYSCPATAYRHHVINREHIPALVDYYENGLYGASWWQSLNLRLFKQPAWCSVQYGFLPLSLIAYFAAAIWTTSRGRGPFLGLLRRDRVMLVLALFMVYNTLAGTLFEIDENARFKFLIEPLEWIFAMVLAHRLVSWLMTHLRPRSPLQTSMTPVPVITDPILPADRAAPVLGVDPLEFGPRGRPLAGWFVLTGLMIAVGMLLLAWQRLDKRARS
ncbi:MAG: hypothetical protein K8J31_18705 [Anaerolineae bacterium]|nr:hypothetical protein [Anaerolineae bacterium]